MAAAVFIPQSPHDPFASMSATSRRAPLASIPNATNSPHRLLATSGSKRPRSLANVIQQENEPPQKRQMVEKPSAHTAPATPRKQTQGLATEGRVFERGNSGSEVNAFQRKLVAARDRGSNIRVTKNVENQTHKDVESIRQWQKHYRRIFPGFNFYFESVPEDARARFARQVTSLGAKEEKFFSKTVSHIVTTRQIPPEIEPEKSSDPTISSKDGVDAPTTINPTLLEKTTTPFAPNGRSQVAPQNGINIRRDGTGNMDVLTRGRQMGMKIWTTEKFQRVLSSIIDDSGSHAHNTRSALTLTNTGRIQREDLSQVLRNEKLGTSSEREQASLTRDLVVFKGPYIYIHDMDAKVRPTMVREYPRVARRQDGDWPQFRSATVGKCPFVEDPQMRREIEQDRAKEKALAMQLQIEAAQAAQIARTRSSLIEKPTMEPPRRTSPRKALQEIRNFTAGPVPVESAVSNKAPIAPKLDRQPSFDRQLSFPPMPDRPPMNFMKPPHMTHSTGREPAASGIQRSNMTSAIQSQMISSTTAAPGAKAGTSREVHELKRKVLERGHTASLSVGSVGSMPSSYRMQDLAGALKNSRAPAPQRAAKSRAQEKLGGIQEEPDLYADDVAAERAAHAVAKKKKPMKRDPKPGYCENCRDKYEDFEEHILSRKHRKFAMTQSNWDDLDDLLAKLQGP